LLGFALQSEVERSLALIIIIIIIIIIILANGGFALERTVSHFGETKAQGIFRFFFEEQKPRTLTKFFAISWKLMLRT
jgi:Trk-type K+ transport system membrane component